jgi:hypothetical protein
VVYCAFGAETVREDGHDDAADYGAEAAATETFHFEVGRRGWMDAMKIAIGVIKGGGLMGWGGQGWGVR